MLFKSPPREWLRLGHCKGPSLNISWSSKLSGLCLAALTALTACGSFGWIDFAHAQSSLSRFAPASLATNPTMALQKGVDADSQSLGSTGDLSAVVWSKVFSGPEASLAKRKVLAEQFHFALGKRTFKPSDEAAVYLGLAALHASDPETRYVVVPFLQHARSLWPALANSKETPKVWQALVRAFSKRLVANEIVLAQAAALLDGPQLANSDDGTFLFYRGLGHHQDGRCRETLTFMERVPLASAHYRRAKYVEAMCLISLGRLEGAHDALQVVISMDQTSAEKGASVPGKTIQKTRELGVLTAARLYYEQGQFLDSLAYYRTLNQDSFYFHESLSEQAWSYFMAGYPNRALGAVYAATSPFFADKFNPDSYFLNPVLYYWMCEFDMARVELTRFVTHSRLEGDALAALVRRNGSLAESESMERYAKVYMDAASGVSARNLGLGPKTLATLLSKDNLQDTHKSLDALTMMRVQLQKKMFFAHGRERVLKGLSDFEGDLRKALGRQVKGQLAGLGGDFEKSLTQGRLLYLEILTAKKDALLGKERTVRGQEFVGDEKGFEEAMNRPTQSWAQDKNEFWFDELGSYVFEVKSKCSQPQGTAVSQQEGRALKK